jgi:recombination protein RecA
VSLVISKEPTQVASTAKAAAKPEEPIVKLTNKADKLKAVALVAASMNKQYDTKLIQKLGKGKAAVRIPSLATNLPTFDEDVCGCGGIPRGRIIEIYGPESAGKTAFCLHIIACAQRAGGLAAIVDAEHALMLVHAKSIGVDIDELIISQPDYGEQALEVVDALAKTGAVDIIVVDSVSALVPKAELDGDMGDSHMGLQARLMSQAMRKLVGTAAKSGTIIIFINQVRMKIGVMFGNPETTTGGNALKFYASLRFEVRRLSKTDGGEIIDPETKNHLGHRMRIKNIKNKVGNPYRETLVDLMYADGFNTRLDTVEFLLDHEGLLVGNQTKENPGNGVPKGWLGFEERELPKRGLDTRSRLG